MFNLTLTQDIELEDIPQESTVPFLQPTHDDELNEDTGDLQNYSDTPPDSTSLRGLYISHTLSTFNARSYEFSIVSLISYNTKIPQIIIHRQRKHKTRCARNLVILTI